MSAMQPRSFDDVAALFALAQMNGYPIPLARDGARPVRRSAQVKRRSLPTLVRSALGRPGPAVAEPGVCATC
jgi:hypothetical protein